MKYLDTLRVKHEKSFFARNNDGRLLYERSSNPSFQTPFISKLLFQNGFRPQYPNGKKFGVCVSHDIDLLHHPNFFAWQRVKSASRELLEGNLKRAAKMLVPSTRVNPYSNLAKILAFEKKHNVCSSFYFLSLLPHEQDYNYSVSSLKEEFAGIISSGNEVGLHGGHLAFNNEKKVLQERNQLEGTLGLSIVGYRNHFLKLDPGHTWPILAKTGFLYDTTYGFPDYPSFRNGLCYPFTTWNWHTETDLPLLEIPLIAMDATYVFYLKWNAEQSFRHLIHLVDEVASVDGVFTLLWHNNLFIGEWGNVFKKVIAHCEKKGAWFATGKEMHAWWTKNDYSKKSFSLLQSLENVRS
jgi:peptidoglycan/xylan/chitin deacetylase (PgdA/CDA1 family)